MKSGLGLVQHYYLVSRYIQILCVQTVSEMRQTAVITDYQNKNQNK